MTSPRALAQFTSFQTPLTYLWTQSSSPELLASTVLQPASAVVFVRVSR